MIHNLFPTKVLIKDTDLSENQLKELEVAIQSIFKSHEALTGSHVETGEDSMPLFTQENIDVFPILRTLKDIFIDGFLELASSFSINRLSRKSIENMMDNHAGRLPIMRNGDYKGLHSHPGTSAFGVFYLSDVDNQKDGGTLILRDPSFHTNVGFYEPMKHPVETKAGRLVIAPSYIWHEVTPYSGNEERITVVSNLVFVPENIIEN